MSRRITFRTIRAAAQGLIKRNLETGIEVRRETVEDRKVFAVYVPRRNGFDRLGDGTQAEAMDVAKGEIEIYRGFLEDEFEAAAAEVQAELVALATTVIDVDNRAVRETHAAALHAIGRDSRFAAASASRLHRVKGMLDGTIYVPSNRQAALELHETRNRMPLGTPVIDHNGEQGTIDDEPVVAAEQNKVSVMIKYPTGYALRWASEVRVA